MPQDRTERRLAAIVAVDVAGFSRLMEADEAGTLAVLKAHRAATDPIGEKYGARLVGTAGDGQIWEFPSVVDAVACAAEIQRAMAARNEGVPKDKRIELRAGVNLGDVLIEGDDIYGDGVNVAARLEGLAEPGGVCISGDVFRQVKNKIDLSFEDLGEQKVKNIAEPIQTYKVLLDPDAPKTVTAPKPKMPALWRWAAAAVVFAIAVVAGVAVWRPWAPDVESARLAKMGFPLPKKPSIAVLPFDYLSGDKKQDYLADGLSENIISSLSKVSEMFVIARNSTFIYKGKPVKVQRLAEELGVQYVLEGSVQRSGERIRVTAQLIDAVKGYHLWSERYDRKLTDLFALQDEITHKIVVALQVKLTEDAQARVRYRSTNNLQAWGYAVRGVKLFGRFTKADNARARELLGRAVALDPQYAYAWCFLAWTHLIDAQFGYSASPAKSFGTAVEIAKKSLTVGPKEPDTHSLMGYIHLFRRDHDQAVAEGRKALELGPNMASVNANMAITMRYVGNWDEAIALGERAARLNPRAPWFVFWNVGVAHTFKGAYTRAVARFEAGLRRAKSDTAKAAIHRGLAFALSKAGQMEKARQHMAQALKLNPRTSARYVRKITFYKDPAHLERVLAALRKAGLPEE